MILFSLLGLVMAAIPLLLPSQVKACAMTSLQLMACAHMGVYDGVYGVEISSPSPSTVTQYVFPSTTPGTLSISCSAGVAPTVAPNDMRTKTGWQWMSPSGSGQTITPAPGIPPQPNMEGTSHTLSISGLPESNSWFGDRAIMVGFYYLKWVTYPYPMYMTAILVDTASINIKYPKEATNHPNPGNGVTPNWYYYWQQTSAKPYGFTVGYSANGHSEFGFSQYEPGLGWRSYVGPKAAWVAIPLDGPYGPEGPPATRETPFWGIDLFAQVCLHEKKHTTQDNTWRPNGTFVSPYLDSDDDKLPDIYDDDPLITMGGPYYPNEKNSDGDDNEDIEDYTYWYQENWVMDSADSEDFSN